MRSGEPWVWVCVRTAPAAGGTRIGGRRGAGWAVCVWGQAATGSFRRGFDLFEEPAARGAPAQVDLYACTSCVWSDETQC